VELHPRIAGKVRSQFLLGDPETAVLVAMKAVEIRVRELGGFPDSLIGVKLMQEAFKAESREAAKPAGPLANPELDGVSSSAGCSCSAAPSRCSRTLEPPAGRLRRPDRGRRGHPARRPVAATAGRHRRQQAAHRPGGP
jgi:hypothetical protein